MKKLFIAVAAAALMVGCASNDTSSQGTTSPDSGMTRGQGAAAEDMQNSTQPANQGGTSSQGGSINGSSSNGYQSTTNSSSGNSPSSSSLGVTPGAAK
jgi:hypothetical protein